MWESKNVLREKVKWRDKYIDELKRELEELQAIIIKLDKNGEYIDSTIPKGPKNITILEDALSGGVVISK